MFVQSEVRQILCLLTVLRVQHQLRQLILNFPHYTPICPPSFLSGSLQVGLWGAESGDEMGNGESYDGDGVGVNTSAEANHP